MGQIKNIKLHIVTDIKTRKSKASHGIPTLLQSGTLPKTNRWWCPQQLPPLSHEQREPRLEDRQKWQRHDQARGVRIPSRQTHCSHLAEVLTLCWILHHGDCFHPLLLPREGTLLPRTSRVHSLPSHTTSSLWWMAVAG